MTVRQELAAGVLTDLLFEEPGVGRCLVAPDGSVLRANAEWLRSTGFSIDDVLGADIVALFPETRDMALALHARVRAGHRVEVPPHAQRVHGRETWWAGTIAPVPMENGTGLLITAREVAPALRDADRERALREHDRRVAELEATFASIADGAILYGRGAEIVRMNRAAEEILGFTQRELAAAGSLEARAAAARISRPDGAPYPVGETPTARALRGETSRGVLMVVHQRSGASRWVSASAAPIRGLDGEVQGAVATFSDVTDRHRAEQALRERNALLGAISDTSRDAIFAKDRDGRLQFANPATLALVGRPLDEVIGRTDAELLDDPVAAREVMRNDRRIMETGIPEEVEERVPLPDGTERVWSSRKSPYRDPDGRVVGLLGISRDITERKRAEEELRSAHATLRSILDSITDGLAVLDRDWRYTYFSETGARMLGLRQEDLIGGCLWDRFPHARDSRFGEEYRRAVATGQPAHFEEFYPEPLNMWVECHAYPSADGLSIYFRDVTKRRRAEDAARTSEALLRSTMDHFPTAIAFRDREGRFLDVNGAVEEALGLPKERIVGRRMHDFVPREVADALDAHAREVMESRRAAQREEVTPLPGGTRYHVTTSFPLVDADGRVYGTGHIANDITDVKRTEEDLRRAVDRYERQARLFDGVASTTPDFVYLFDLRGRFLYANRRLLEVWGMPLPDVVGKTCLELGYEQWHHDMHMREIAQVIETRRPIKGEVPFKAPLTGISGVYEYIFTPVIGPDGEVEIIAGTTRDVTERKRAEDALRDADRRKSEFLAVLSHELRNPLAPIRNGIYLLERAAPGSEQALRAKEVVRRQTEHLTRLIDDLLDITRISRGKVVLHRARLDLREIVRRTTDDLQSVFSQAGVELRVDQVLAPVWTDADPTRVSQVLGNLLQNAVKFTPAGGVVTVNVGASAGSAELSVRDTGIGMDPAQIARMFEPFVQADQSLARTDGGLGLGLALVKALVELHGGTVEARSEGPGRGAEFVVRLPLGERSAHEPPGGEPSPEVAAQG